MKHLWYLLFVMPLFCVTLAGIPVPAGSTNIQYYLDMAADGEVVVFEGSNYTTDPLIISRNITLDGLMSNTSLYCLGHTITVQCQGCKVILNGLHFVASGQTADRDCGVNIAGGDANVEIRFSTFHFTRAIITYGANLTLTNSSICNCFQALLISSSTLFVQNVLFQNTVMGIYGSYSNIKISSSSFLLGPDSDALSIDGGNTEVENITIISQDPFPDATYFVVSIGNGQANFSNCNISILNSGGFFIYDSAVILDSVSVTNPQSDENNYGTVPTFFVRASDITLRQCTIFDVSAFHSEFEGVLRVTSSTVTIEDSSFYQNNATIGLSFENSDVTIKNTQISDNVATSNGGAIWFSGHTLKIYNSTMVNNTALGLGGAVWADKGTVKVENSKVSNNFASDGGAFYFDMTSPLDTITFTNNTIIHNMAPRNQAIRYTGDQLFIQQSQIQHSSINSLLPSNFCCNSTSIASPNRDTCNYPACNSACIGADGCNCPVNNLCSSCMSPFGGDLCLSEQCPLCSNLSTCLSKNATIECDCIQGYIGDGYNCTDINECTAIHACSYFATCNNTQGSYNCTCQGGYSGNGFECNDVDECAADKSPCVNEGYCVNIPGSYQCIPCRPGYKLENSTCIDINECLADNGGCDWHVQCTNTLGNRTCGDCPFGYEGNGYSRCLALCGDGRCDAGLAETCVSCPLDCKDTTCGVCGDGQCENSSTESCKSCYEDCQHNCNATCNFCSEHGTCVMGVCVCTDQWTGPSCSERSTVITVVLDPILPSISIQPTKPSSSSIAPPQNFSFVVGLRAIYEVNRNGSWDGMVDMTNVNFSLWRSPLSNATANQMWVLSSTLPNQANLNITFLQFQDPMTNYSFYGDIKTYAANSVKINVRISNWPFKSISNNLEVVMDSETRIAGEGRLDEDDCHLSRDSHLLGQTIVWTKQSLFGVTVYAKFDPDSYVDGRKRAITFLPRHNAVAAIIPHFWTFAELDPTYTVLINPDETVTECTLKNSKNRVNTVLIIAISVPIVGVALLSVIPYIVYKRRRSLSAYLKNRSSQLQMSPLVNGNTVGDSLIRD